MKNTFDSICIEEKIGYTFKNKELLIQAFTRNSFASEHNGWKSNEGLEFVGDKVLDIIVVKKLTELYCAFEQTIRQSLDSISRSEKISQDNIEESICYTNYRTEAEMTELKKRIVQTAYLASAVSRLGIEDYLIISRGDEKQGVNKQPHVMEDLFEAIVGAVAIDSSWNMSILEELVERILNLDAALKSGIAENTDYISLVHSWHMTKYGTAPNYIISESEDASELFLSILFIDGSHQFDGTGYSKAEAKRQSAKRAWEYIDQLEQKQNRLLSAIGGFDFDNAVSKLTELSEKKLISGLSFIFKEGDKAESGNPTWYCRCVVDGVEELVEYGDEKKSRAKKASAYTMLEILTTGEDSVLKAITAGLDPVIE